MGKKHRKPKKLVDQGEKELSRKPASGVGLLIVLTIVVCVLVAAAHWPVLSAQAQFFDDQQYLTENLLVQNPGWTSARRFLTEVLEPSTVRGYYQPLAMISLMVDYALGGREHNLMPFHRTSLALHMANTALIIVLLYLLFGQIWVAAGVGLLFGLHPMTVEPIPWISERKTLLAAFFALWCLILYVRSTSKNDWKLYLGCVATYILALMSKPTTVPLPVLMLLLDFWPLKRLKWQSILEKLPFFVVGGIFAIITYISQARTAAVTLPSAYGPERIPLILCHNIIFYLYKIIWPFNLSSHYAFPKPLALSNPMVLAGVIGTCILIPLLIISLRWTRAVLTGWLFFFVAVLPTMQIIGFSNVIASDKFAYLPSIGLLMVLTAGLTWLFSKICKDIPLRAAVVVMVLILAGAETAATRGYLVHWRDTVSHYKYMLKLSPDTVPLHNDLGVALLAQGKLDEAISHYRQALQYKPDHVKAHTNLGIALSKQGKFDKAISHYRRTLQLKPGHVKAHNNLGNALSSQGKLDEAISHYRQALQYKPDHVKAHNNLGVALSKQGKFDEAISHYRQTLELSPNFVGAHVNLGNILISQGKLDEAISYYRRALQLNPNLAIAHNNLGNALISQGKLDEAISHYRQALRIKPDYTNARKGLEAALAKRQKRK
jgi:tetratricopeptide (TPR) repeat protein